MNACVLCVHGMQLCDKECARVRMFTHAGTRVYACSCERVSISVHQHSRSCWCACAVMGMCAHVVCVILCVAEYENVCVSSHWIYLHVSVPGCLGMCVFVHVCVLCVCLLCTYEYVSVHSRVLCVHVMCTSLCAWLTMRYMC